jgi:hypothetical protein
MIRCPWVFKLTMVDGVCKQSANMLRIQAPTHFDFLLAKKFFLSNIVQTQFIANSSYQFALKSDESCGDVICFGLRILSDTPFFSEMRTQTTCSSSNLRPPSTRAYVLRNPDEEDLGAKKVSFAVPTTRCISPPRATNGTNAKENAASLFSIGSTNRVFI